LDDLDDNLAMDLDPEVHRHIFRRGPPDRDAHRAALRERILSGWPPQGALWVVEWRARPGFLGWCGLFPLEASGLIEIGYRYVRRAWGQGVATEAGCAVLDYGFRGLDLDPVVALARCENLASRHVLEKLGLPYRGLRFHYGLDLAFYELSRREYLASTHDRPGGAPTRPLRSWSGPDVRRRGHGAGVGDDPARAPVPRGGKIGQVVAARTQPRRADRCDRERRLRPSKPDSR
jgi:ribosomal-protein-alanine N-acetyltransferase